MEKEIMLLLKNIRKKNKISAKTVADAIGISINTLYQYESEGTTTYRSLDMNTFFRWCEALGKKPHIVCGTIWEKDHPRSHTSKKKQVERLKKKSFGELTAEELEFLAKHGGQ
jgi:transcriptional regulator with XRE-family HTH domain